MPSLYIYDIHVQHFRMNEHGSLAYLYIGSTVWSCLLHLVMYWLSYWIGHYLIWCMSQFQIFLYPDAHGASRMPRASPTHGPAIYIATLSYDNYYVNLRDYSNSLLSGLL